MLLYIIVFRREICYTMWKRVWKEVTSVFDENDSKSLVVDLTRSSKSTGLELEVAYKTTGDWTLFSTTELRQSLVDSLDRIATEYQVTISHVKVTDFSIQYSVMLSDSIDFMDFVNKTAVRLVSDINSEYPSLNLRRTMGKQPLSRVWHRPYYVATVTPNEFPVVDEYLCRWLFLNVLKKTRDDLSRVFVCLVFRVSLVVDRCGIQFCVDRLSTGCALFNNVGNVDAGRLLNKFKWLHEPICEDCTLTYWLIAFTFFVLFTG